MVSSVVPQDVQRVDEPCAFARGNVADWQRRDVVQLQHLVRCRRREQVVGSGREEGGMYLEHLLDGEVAVGDVPLLDGDWRVEPGHCRHLHQLAQIVTVLEATTAFCFLHLV